MTIIINKKELRRTQGLLITSRVFNGSYFLHNREEGCESLVFLESTPTIKYHDSSRNPNLDHKRPAILTKETRFEGAPCIVALEFSRDYSVARE